MINTRKQPRFQCEILICLKMFMEWVKSLKTLVLCLCPQTIWLVLAFMLLIAHCVAAGSFSTPNWLRSNFIARSLDWNSQVSVTANVRDEVVGSSNFRRGSSTCQDLPSFTSVSVCHLSTGARSCKPHYTL
jgi:hypothetical protein